MSSKNAQRTHHAHVHTQKQVHTNVKSSNRSNMYFCLYQFLCIHQQLTIKGILSFSCPCVSICAWSYANGLWTR